MADSEFEKRVAELNGISFREDFEAALYGLYKSATPNERNDLRTAIRSAILHPPESWRNPGDFNRSDLSREERLRRFLIHLSITDGSADFRDDLITIAHCYHNFKVMGLDADRVLEKIAEISAPKFANLILGFVQRPPGLKSLEAFRLAIVQTPEGPTVEFI